MGLEDEKKEPNTNQAEGRVGQATGEIKDVAGEKSGDEQLENEGEAEKVAGRAQEKLGDKQAEGEGPQ
jgi:uncharacterized protein YjbJ (UPF0337 family)